MAEPQGDKLPRISLGSPPYRWPAWYGDLKRFERRDRRKAAWQIADTVIPYLVL